MSDLWRHRDVADVEVWQVLKNGLGDVVERSQDQEQAYDVWQEVLLDSEGPAEMGREAKGPNLAKESFLGFILDDGCEGFCKCWARLL